VGNALLSLELGDGLIRVEDVGTENAGRLSEVILLISFLLLFRLGY
jgi:hypothetical protein